MLNSLQPQLQTTAATLFQPQAASLQQVTSQPTQVTGTQVTASQVAAAQMASAIATTMAQPGISVAALQTAGLSLNPAIVSLAFFTCDQEVGCRQIEDVV